MTPHNKIMLTCNGETLDLKQWSKRTGLTEATIRYRLHAGYSAERALSKGLDNRGRRKQPDPTALQRALPELERYRRNAQRQHAQLERSIAAFTRTMRKQMRDLRFRLDAALADQQQMAIDAVTTPRVGQNFSEVAGEHSPSSAQDRS